MVHSNEGDNMEYIANERFLDESDEEILQDAINTYGRNSQINIAMEELAELIQALSKFNRDNSDRSTVDNISEEMADVIIMLSQLEIIFGNEEDIIAFIDSKLKRLYNRIKSVKEGI